MNSEVGRMCGKLAVEHRVWGCGGAPGKEMDYFHLILMCTHVCLVASVLSDSLQPHGL